MQNKPIVSVCMITYGHENYIREAIESVLMQKCNFEVELILANDCSNDQTNEVIQDILKTHQNRSWIKYHEHKKNIGMMPNFQFALEKCTGKYIALCDGDDYWTDELKLQKQVDFLDNNQEYVLCSHTTEEKNEVNNSSVIFPQISQNTTKGIEDYIIENLTATCSILFKSEFLNPIPVWFRNIKFGDLALILMLFYRSNQKMMILKECMGVYRINNDSVHGSLKNDNASLIKAYKMHLDFINTINKKLFLEQNHNQYVLKKRINTHSILANLYKNNSKVNYYIHLLRKHLLKSII